MGYVTTMLGGTGRVATRRRALAAVWCAAIACVLWALLAVAPARADEAGYLTLSGVVGVDEEAAYATLADAVAALSSCDAAAQESDRDSASILVHGTVSAGGAYDLAYPVDGSTVALVGSGADARIAVADGPLSLANGAGSLVVRGVSFSGAVTLTSRDNLMVEASSFDSGILCRAGGSVGASGNVFQAAVPGPGVAFAAELAGDGATLSFSGNEVAGFGCGVAVTAEGLAAAARVTSNQFSLAGAGAGGAQDRSSALRLAGGPWGAASVVCEGNGATGADVAVVLDATFSFALSSPEGTALQGVSADNVETRSVEALFELIGTGALSAGEPLIGLDSAYDGTSTAEAVSRSFAPAEQLASAEDAASFSDMAAEEAISADEGVAYRAAATNEVAANDPAFAAVATVSYEANGATAGAAPAPLSAPVGSSVTAETMGSLVYAGHVFEGWNTAPDGSGSFYAAGQVFSLLGDTVLYAQWAPTGTVATMSVSTEVEQPANGDVA